MCKVMYNIFHSIILEFHFWFPKFSAVLRKQFAQYNAKIELELCSASAFYQRTRAAQAQIQALAIASRCRDCKHMQMLF